MVFLDFFASNVIDYLEINGDEGNAADLDVEVLMRRWHDRLLRNLFLLYSYLYKARLKRQSVCGRPWIAPFVDIYAPLDNDTVAR